MSEGKELLREQEKNQRVLWRKGYKVIMSLYI